MNYREALGRLQQFLAPLPVEEFFDRVLPGGFCKVAGDAAAPRTMLLGPDPQALLTDAVHLAPKLTFHSANPTDAAPSLESVQDAADFRQRIDEFHARNYSVRFPDLRPLSAPLDILARALEMLLHAPVTASAFWSRGGMRAPVHYDDHDLLVVQLRGAKRWYVASNPSELNNTWRGIPESAPELGPHHTVDVQPGDLLYFPRGTLHTVDADSESLHLSIGFTPLTVRAAVIAALDQLSDLDRGWRMSFGGPLALLLRGPGIERFNAPTVEAAGNLATACKAAGFLASALQSRSARAVAALTPLRVQLPLPAIDLDSELVQGEMAFCHLTASPENIDVSYPGGHIYVHRGAQQSLEHIVNTPRFRVREIPGDVGDDVRLSLARRFLEIGYLELAPPGGQEGASAPPAGQPAGGQPSAPGSAA
jgi:bifunctional lysine-specific demethylase and histidyl-hydroxylase MINA